MKKIILYCSLIFGAHTAFAATDSTWIDQVRVLRDAIYQHDKEKVKTFFDLPMKTEPEFWFNVGLPKLGQEEAPLTAERLDRNFDHIFDEQFVKALLKLKTKELYEKGTTTTPAFSDTKYASVSMEATYDSKEHTVTFTLNGRQIVKGDNNNTDAGEDTDAGAFSLFYVFRIVGNHLKFKGIWMAG